MRQSGRTSRMLNEAVELAREGKNVTIVAATPRHAFHIASEILTYDGVTTTGGMKIRFRGIITITYIGDISFDMRSKRIRGLHDKVLIDHYAQEVYDGRIT